MQVFIPFKSQFEPGTAGYIRQVIDLICEPGAVYELRCPKVIRHGTISGYYDDFDKLAEDAAALSGNVTTVYITLNPTDRRLLSRGWNECVNYAEVTTTDKEITKRRWMLIDVDSIRPAGISSTDEEKELSLDLILRVREHMETITDDVPIFADSGNGFHLLYPLADWANDEKSTAMIKNCLQALANRFNTDRVKVDTSVFNSVRLTKLYGTLTMKGRTPTPDRPHRFSKILEVPAK